MSAAFVPSHFEKLHRVLIDSIASPARVSNTNEWYIAIDRSRAELVDLARAKRPNDAERREIQSGKVTIEGVVHTLNDDFAQQSLALAQYLDISERYAASLLQAGFEARARWSRSAIEVACILFHRERLSAFQCLKDLISGAATLSREDDVASRKLGAKMRQLVNSLLAGKVSLPDRILSEIDSLKVEIEKTRQKLQSGTAQQQGFGDQIQLERIKMIRQERQELGHVLYLLSFSHSLNTKGVLALGNWLALVSEQDQADAMVIYLLTTFLSALELPSEEEELSSTLPQIDLIDDRAFVKQIHADLTTKAWKVPQIKSVALLQWCIFLIEATKRSPGISNELKLQQESVQKLFMEAVSGDAFYCIVLRILAFRQRQIDALEGEENDTNEAMASKSSEESEVEGEIDVEFQEYVMTQMQDLVLSITSIMLPQLRKLQRSEEDSAFASSRGIDYSRGGSEPPPRRYDIEALFDTVALLCRARPESGLPFWQGADGKGTRFLNWAIEVRESGHQRALFEMLASLAAGKNCAWQAHSLLSSGDASAPQLNASTGGAGFLTQGRMVSWSKLFDWVQQYIDNYRQPTTAGGLQYGAMNVSSASQHTMTPNDAILLRGFFRLLRNVAFYSVAAREALYQHSAYELVPRLFSLYTCPIIIEVKASILDALAAFAHPSGNHFAKITAQLWSMVENAQALGSPPSAAGQRMTSSSSAGFLGAYHDLQSVETPARIYPATTSFVNFLKSLVHVPSRQRDSPIATAAGSAATLNAQQGIHLGLGQGQRVPGLEPYVSFVVDTVLLPAGVREYSDPAERWRVTSSCLDFVERCLASYDLSTLLSSETSGTDGVELAALASHSGFSIMKRILTGGRLLQEILSILNPNAGVAGANAGFEIVNSNRASTLFYSNSVRLCLRIIQRVLRIQDIFLQVLLPTLSDAANSASGGGHFAMKDLMTKMGHPSSYSPLDTLLLHAHQSVVQLALYVNCVRDDIALLAVRIMTLLAQSAAFSGVDRFGEMGYNRKMNRLVGLLEMSDEADRVRAGCVDRLEEQAAEVNTDLDSHVKATLALMQIAGEDDDALDAEYQGIVAPTTDAKEAIRLAILDLLLVNTGLQVEAPNIAHLLLGFDLRAVHADDQIIPDPHSVDAPPSALHAILMLLRPDGDEATLTLSQRSPAFAEKCHQLIYNLCVHPFTSMATLRYLRTKEGFFVKQLRALPYMPIKRTSAQMGALGMLIRPDGGHLSTTVDALVASLHIRSHLLSGAALELHTLCNAGLWAPAAQLIAVLLGHDSVLLSGSAGYGGGGDGDGDDDDDDYEDDDDFDDGMGRRYEQGGIRLLDLLSSFDFEWHDAREERAQEPSMLKNLDLSQALSANASGLREFDIHAAIGLLATARRELERRGELNESKQRAEFDKDAILVMEHISARNANRVIAFARRGAMQSWRNALDMTLTRASHLLKAESRSNIVFECLAVLLPRLSGSTLESDPALLDLIAGAILALLTELRHHQTDDSGLDQLPIDRLVATLRALVAAITEPGTTMLARGNLYSALVNYIQLVKGSLGEEDDGAEDGASVVDTISEADDSVSFTGFSSIAGGESSRGGGGRRSNALMTRSRTLLASHAERLVPIIARDALDASDVWRTVAFTLFDRLCSLQQRSNSSRNVLLDILHKKGYLKSFVANVREMDFDLQQILRPDPSSLNALYVYESTLAFFNRLAQSRQGAEKLLEARLFDVLSQVDFLQARPQQDYQYAQEQDFDELDSFVPAVASRYEALLLPALQLSVGVLASLDRGGSSLGLRLGSTASHAAPRQALSFLQAHRNTLLVSLKNATMEVISLSTINQAQLLIQLFLSVLPILDDEALAPPNPLSAFHNSILALSANFLYESNRRGRILPHTEAEREDASRLVSTGLSEGQSEQSSAFDLHAEQCVERLLSTLLAYLEKASEFRGVNEEARKRVRPCFTSSLYTHASNRGGIVADEYDHSGRYGLHSNRQPHVASLGIALASMDGFVTQSNANLLQLDKIQGILDNVDSVRIDEWYDIVGADVEDVPPAKRKVVGVKVIKAQRVALKSRLFYHLNCIEMLLILLYRHFDYYIQLGTRFQQQTPTDLMASSLRRSVTPSVIGGNETAALIRDGNKIVTKVLEKLNLVIASLQSDAGGITNAEERRAFLEMTARKLQGTLLEKLDVV